MARPLVYFEAAELVSAWWGWQGPLEVQELAGYDDRNLKVVAADGRAAVFKVHNVGDSVPEGQVAEAHNALLAVLAAQGLPVPAALPVVDGSSTASDDDALQPSPDGHTIRTQGADGKLHACRMLTWLPGVLLVEAPKPLELYRQLGALLGRVQRVLQGWDWESSGALRRPDFEWNVQHLVPTYVRLRADLLALPGLDLPLLDAVVAHFAAATSAAEAAGQLRSALIHSDANERNVLVDAAAAAAAAVAERQQGSEAAAAATAVASAAPVCVDDGNGRLPQPMITGLIDWGDACWQWLASEVANCATYMMLLECNADDPLPAAAAVLAGFESQLPLLPGERALLRTLCMARLAQSLSLGARAAARDPSNAPYLLATQRHGWALLRRLWGMSDEQYQAAMSAGGAP
ncbi:hydroxylysine kinase isoform B [Micractinium conductrix]|uniref:Hydroxylysine kinase n=1 Tax=Micractinium conductrix TaxID=554055 RepID=A0A2P6V0W6_9CHLO|nr:hydroxylysine kinase isoform B [Micractinium conductrix]|eukprot:PSC67732.1 hydroxylysine kinase isoform B [Micractinium conductrix]